jgi:transporter family protein
MQVGIQSRKIENVDWLIFALIGTIFFSAAGVLDKFLLSSYTCDSKAYIVCQVLVQQIFTIPILAIMRIDFVYPQSAMAMALGALQILPSLFYLRAVQVEEASRVAALEYFYPVFVFLGAFIFLGENLAPKHCIGGVLLVVSVLLISHKHKGKCSFDISSISPALRPFISYWISMAIYCIALKYLLASMNEWQLYTWSSLGSLMATLPLLANPSVRGEVLGFFESGTSAVGTLISEETFMFLGIIFSIFAYALGSVALVTSVGALQPMLTLILVVALGLFLPGRVKEELDRNSLVQKGLSSIIVIIGIYFVS